MGYNILIVDDSSALRKVLIKTIRMCKLGESRFWQAAHGEEALEVLEKEWIDVIFTDINMPIMNGIELLKEISKQENYKATPIIVVTSETRDTAKAKFRDLGATGVISKPFRPEEIQSNLEEILHFEESTDEEATAQGYDF